MKKLLSIILAGVMVFSLTACGGGTEENKPDFTFAFVNLSQEETISEQSAWDETDTQDEVTVVDEDNFTVNDYHISSGGYGSADAAIMAFDGGKTDGVYLSRSAAQYLCSSRENLHLVEDTWIALYQMAAQPDKADLLNKIDEKFTQWKADGTLDKLAKDYLEDETIWADMPVVSARGAEEWPAVNVAVTGGIPPFDYVSGDGTPAGFNTALLAALSEALQISFNPVVVETDARMLALSSQKVDLLFWVSGTNEELVSNDKLLFSQPYHTEHFAYVTTKEFLPIVEEISKIS